MWFCFSVSEVEDISSNYTVNRAQSIHISAIEASRNPAHSDFDDESKSDPLAGIDGIGGMGRGGTLTFDVKTKGEWSGDEETKQKEVWLDVQRFLEFRLKVDLKESNVQCAVKEAKLVMS